MNTAGDAAEQIVKMSLNGVEVAAKITGAGAKELAMMIYAILKDQKKDTCDCCRSNRGYDFRLRPNVQAQPRVVGQFSQMNIQI